MHKVVARYRRGRVLKGHVREIDVNRGRFRLETPGGHVVEIVLADLKALFFVRSLNGDANRHEDRIPDPGDPRLATSRLVTLVFEDGEVMTGLMQTYPTSEPFFFLVPVDVESNNIRILVQRAAVAVMEAVEQV